MVVGAKIQKLSFGSGALVLSFSRRRKREPELKQYREAVIYL
jgi:hypothetical protein